MDVTISKQEQYVFQVLFSCCSLAVSQFITDCLNVGFWRMRDKIGLPLDEIHLSGNVPQCKNLRCLFCWGKKELTEIRS